MIGEMYKILEYIVESHSLELESCPSRGFNFLWLNQKILLKTIINQI